MRTLRVVPPPPSEDEVEIKRRINMIEVIEACLTAFVLVVASAIAAGVWAAIAFWTFLFATGQT